jgi:cytochrome c oxidase subunit 4
MKIEISTQRRYVLVAVALLALLALTVGLSMVDLGHWGMPVAVTIAATKAALVLTVFMEVRVSGPVVRALAAASALWLSLLLGGTLADYMSRNGRAPAELNAHYSTERTLGKTSLNVVP